MPIFTYIILRFRAPFVFVLLTQTGVAPAGGATFASPHFESGHLADARRAQMYRQMVRRLLFCDFHYVFFGCIILLVDIINYAPLGRE
jgi:hypothetical protein